MEKQTNRAEMGLKDFFQAVELRTAEILQNPNDSDFELPNGMKYVREGNPSDLLKMYLHTKSREARRQFEELSKEKSVPKTDFHHLQALAKLVLFCEKQENLFVSLAEPKDDSALNELASVMWGDMQETYEKYIKQFNTPSLE